jgi:hypothetical protein
MYRVTIITEHDQIQQIFDTEQDALELYDLANCFRVFLHKRIKDGWTLLQKKETTLCAV